VRPLMLLREAWVSVYTRLVPAVLIAVLSGSMCASTLLTVGRTASAQAGILARLEQAGSRELIVTDRTGGLLDASVVAVVAGLDSLERAVGLTAARDVRTGTLPLGGTLVPAWEVVGDISAVATLLVGRYPQPGEALASQSAMTVLGHDGPTGYVVSGDNEYAIVGLFVAREPFTNLNDGIIIAAPAGTTALSLHVIARRADVVAVTQQLTLSIVAAPRVDDIAVQSAVALATLQGSITGDLGLFGRQLLLLVMGGGMVLTLVVVLADVLLRRADLGRRRALGATHRVIVALVVLRTLIAAVAGAGIGTTVAILVLRQSQVTTPTTFVMGTVTLTLVAALVAAVGPAVLAAARDPVGVLRTP